MQNDDEEIDYSTDYRFKSIVVNSDKGQLAFSEDDIEVLASNMDVARSKFEDTFDYESFEVGGWERDVYYTTVIADTIRYFQGGAIPIPTTNDTGTYTVEELKKKGHAYVDQFTVEYKILNQDILKTARDLAAEGRERGEERHISVFNPENKNYVGGGAFTGAPNFEEDLFRVSNLCISYVDHARETGMTGGRRPGYLNKLNDRQAHFTKYVTFIKEIKSPEGFHWYNKKFNNLLPEKKHFQCSVIGNAALQLTERRYFNKYEREDTKDKIRAQISSAVKNNVTHPIFLDFGCGAFKNRPEEIAHLYADVLYKEGYAGFFQQVNFSIANPNNCAVFKRIFNNRITIRPRIEEPIRNTRAIPAATNIDKEEQTPFIKKRPELSYSRKERINKIVKLVSDDFEKTLQEAKEKKLTPEKITREKIKTIKFLKNILDSDTASNGLKAIAIDAATAGKAHKNQFLEKAINDQYGTDANKDNAITKILLKGIEDGETLKTIEDKIEDYVQDLSTGPEPSPGGDDGSPRPG